MFKKLFILSTAIAIVFNASTSWSAKESSKASTDNDVDTYELLNLFGEVLERAKMSYVEEVSDKKLIESAINGMLVALDPHSSFLDDQSFKYMNQQTKGKFGGLGIEVTMEQGLVMVVSPIDDTPAFKAGIKPGDFITHIDGEQVMGMSLNDAVDKMRGKIGAKVKLTIRRVNKNRLNLQSNAKKSKYVRLKVNSKMMLYISESHLLLKKQIK